MAFESGIVSFKRESLLWQYLILSKSIIAADVWEQQMPDF